MTVSQNFSLNRNYDFTSFNYDNFWIIPLYPTTNLTIHTVTDPQNPMFKFLIYSFESQNWLNFSFYSISSQ